MKVENLTKKYGKQTVAVDSLNMKVHKGEVYGFLGPNGAGKTTTLRMLFGLTRPTSGSAMVRGKPLGNSEGLVKAGGLIESPAFYPYLSGRKNLIVMARYSAVPITQVNVVLEQVGLSQRANDKFKTYSMGMKQRLGIAAALLKDPELLILDEPTNGLDPKGMAEIRTLIRKLAKKGRSVLLSSHLLGEVEQICDRIGVIQDGKIVTEGTVAQLRGQVRLFLRATPTASALRVLEEMNDVGNIEEKDGALIVAADPSQSANISHQLAENHIEISELRSFERSLEDIFMELTEQERPSENKESAAYAQ